MENFVGAKQFKSVWGSSALFSASFSRIFAWANHLLVTQAGCVYSLLTAGLKKESKSQNID